MLFLMNVAKIDAEIESVPEGDTQTMDQRKAKFMKEKYGTLTKVNKFSLSRIEWIDSLYEKER